jgi:hypothetical protein
MLKMENKKTQVIAKAGQAAIELAVFGAILVFILGTIVRSAVGNSYTQNQNFKAMRMAMLASWNSSKAGNTSRTSASILFVEDRLSPDFNKYGALDRNPFIAQGSGTFSYEELYPLDVGEVASNLPIMDVYINGQYFPFTTASYVTNKTITKSTQCSSDCNASTPQQQQCLKNQSNRNKREWALPTVNASLFDYVVPFTFDTTNNYSNISKTKTDTTMAANGNAIFNELANEGVISLALGSNTQGTVNSSTLPTSFVTWFENKFPSAGQTALNQIQSILQSNMTSYKLFYTRAVNGGQTAPFFLPTPPACSSTTSSSSDSVSYNALCSTLTVLDANGNPYTNSSGDMQYDLQRLGDYTSVEQQFPAMAETGGVTACSATTAANMRCYVAWQWAATAVRVPSTTAASSSVFGLFSPSAGGATIDSVIGLNASNNQYPQYDIDGRIAEEGVTIYAISLNSDGTPTVSYEDPQGGDIDGIWDQFTSCGPKPGLQPDSQIFTFTQDGTYLQIKEGKLYNPETDQFVRSANKRDTIDLIQRTIQLSNNTGRFCDQNGNRLTTVANDGVTPNPVEVCIPPGSNDNCFSSQQNIKSTCFYANSNMLFVRSRLQDRRGHFWMTDTSGQLRIK